MRIFISTGEASGDAYGAALANEMRRLSSVVPRPDFVQRVRESRYWPAELEAPTPASSSEKARLAFAELLGYELEDVVPADLPEYEALERLPWEEIPDRLYDLLVERNRDRMTPHRYEGVGGRRMREAGVELVADSGSWGAISISQSLQVVPKVLGGYYRAKRQLGRGEPGLFIPIDFGYANIRLARHAKNRGWKVLYFVPPGSWRRDRQGADLPRITDAISTPFSWSAEILRGMGANAHWFGHPIKQLLDTGNRGDARRADRIGVLPGSRHHEISENLPLIAEVVRQAAYPEIEFGLAPSVDVSEFQALWAKLAPGRSADLFTQADTAGVLRRARAAIVCSGTATLEAALCHCPMVVVYRVSKAVVMEAKILRFKRPKYIALPNILLDRPVVPELLQDEATPESVRRVLDSIAGEGEARDVQLKNFQELDRILGPNDAITQTAKLALKLE